MYGDSFAQTYGLNLFLKWAMWLLGLLFEVSVLECYFIILIIFKLLAYLRIVMFDMSLLI